MSDEQDIALIKGVLVQLTGVIISTRATLRIVMHQPTLLLSQDQRKELSEGFTEGADRLDKAMAMIERLLEIPNE